MFRMSSKRRKGPEVLFLLDYSGSGNETNALLIFYFYQELETGFQELKNRDKKNFVDVKWSLMRLH